MDIIIFYNYENKYESINEENIKDKYKNYTYIVCGLINGFIEIYSILKDKLKLTLSFKAHRDIISKIIQLKESGYLLTGSYDNSLKIFKLSNNCNKETLIYNFNLNIIFIRVNDMIEMSYNNNIIISSMNYIINFPIKKNSLSENKNNLSDYNITKFEHQKKFLNKLLEISKDSFIALDETDNKILCFKLNYLGDVSEDIVLIKIIDTYLNNLGYDHLMDDYRNNFNRKICLECLVPKYNCLVLSDGFYIKVIDIKFLEIVSIFQINEKRDSFVMSYDGKINKIFIFDKNGMYKYRINNDNYSFELEKENEKITNINNVINLNEVQKIIFSPVDQNKAYVFYKKILMIVDVNNFEQ
jgi:WD40 repeat protein